VNEGRALVIKDGPQCPGNDESARKVAVDGGERVRSGSTFQAEEGEEHKDFGPNSSGILSRIDAKGLKGGQEHNNDRPPMPHGKWQMHKQFITQ